MACGLIACGMGACGVSAAEPVLTDWGPVGKWFSHIVDGAGVLADTVLGDRVAADWLPANIARGKIVAAKNASDRPGIWCQHGMSPNNRSAISTRTWPKGRPVPAYLAILRSNGVAADNQTSCQRVRDDIAGGWIVWRGRTLLSI